MLCARGKEKVFHTFHFYQTQSVHQNRMPQQATMNHCELQPVTTSPSPPYHLLQSLYLMLAQEAQEAPPQLEG